jgi:hypothetical protein
VPITPFLDVDDKFDPETKRVMRVAFETARIALRLADRDDALEALVAKTIIELAKAGERNPTFCVSAFCSSWASQGS